MVNTSREQFSPSQLCRDIEFTVGDFCYEPFSVGEETRIRFHARNNILDTEIDSFMFFLDYEGTMISVLTLPNDGLKGGEVKVLFTVFIEDVLNIKEIKIVPRIKGDTKIILCEGKEEVVNWEEELKEC